ncbi:MAG: OmpA family protein [Polyangiaceae bacterium]
MRRVAAVLLVTTAPFVLSCAGAPALRGKIDGMTAIVERADRNGAKRCAPRELALSRSNLRFAATDLDQGHLDDAERHFQVAEANGKAALAMSPPEQCGDVEPKSGDKDGDGILDDADKCPTERETWNTYQDDDGCPDDPDTDSDRIPDSIDQCIVEAEDYDGFQDDDGCPDTDNDADGVADGNDRCPNQKEDPDGFEDEDGCPDPDNDRDTVADVDDLCPTQPGVPGGEKPGCPRKNVIVTDKEIRITQQIQFQTNKAVIKPESFVILDAVRDVLKDNPKIALEVQGHTDNTGNAQLNMKLSQSRAESVRNYLVAHGIDKSRLIAKGYGMTQPLVPNNSEGNKALNRRVQFIRTEAKTAVP